MWTKLNQVMFRFGPANPNFKGFMADSAHANWNVVCIVYDSKDAFREDGWQGTNLPIPLDLVVW